MPGIAGIVGKSGISPDQIERMTKLMLHEPEYVSGTYVNEQLGLGVGWAAHPNSFAGAMPLWNEQKDVCLIFAGEDFMERADIERYSGRRVDPGSRDAQYLIALYEALGAGFIERLNGRFSGLLIDLRRKLVLLFNDRYGLGRIYIHETQERCCFASEAKSLLALVPEARQLDPRGVAETFACGSVLQNRTLFQGITLLPPGSVWSFAPGRPVTKETYFHPEKWQHQSQLTSADFYDQLKDTFGRILPKYLGGKEPIAMSLTGGLDGRMIMACANPEPGGLSCYTFGSSYRDCSDVKLARRIAAACSQSHRVIEVESEFLNQFPELAEKAIWVSDGAMDVTGAVELYANRMARQIAPIRLTGNYGSEIVRGNVAFRPSKQTGATLTPEYGERVREAHATYHTERLGNVLSFIAFKQVPWHHYARLSVEQSQLTLRSPFLDNELVALMYRAPTDQLASLDPSLKLIQQLHPQLAKLPTDRGIIYGDASLRGKARAMLADFTTKAEYAYDYGMPQWLAPIDRLLSPLHPEHLFLGRHKFYHFRVWYRDRFSQFLKDTLLSSSAKQRPYVQGVRLEQIVHEHTQGRSNWTLEINRVLTLELLQRRLSGHW